MYSKVSILPYPIQNTRYPIAGELNAQLSSGNVLTRESQIIVFQVAIFVIIFLNFRETNMKAKSGGREWLNQEKWGTEKHSVKFDLVSKL